MWICQVTSAIIAGKNKKHQKRGGRPGGYKLENGCVIQTLIILPFQICFRGLKANAAHCVCAGEPYFWTREPWQVSPLWTWTHCCMWHHMQMQKLNSRRWISRRHSEVYSVGTGQHLYPCTMPQWDLVWSVPNHWGCLSRRMNSCWSRYREAKRT